MVGEKIKDQIKKALRELNLPDIGVVLEHPGDERHGDYSTNVALKIKSSKLKVKSKYWNSKEIAKAIAKKLREILRQPGISHDAKHAQDDKLALNEFSKLVKSIEVEGSGFINFWLSEQFLLDEIKRVLDLGDKYGTGESRKGKKIMVEYTDPNPFKEFHIGHLFSNFIGESLSRLFEASGATVWRADFYGDVGMHVAKSVWGMMQKMKKEKVTLSQLKKRSIKQRQEFLGQGYALGVNKYEEDKKVQEEIKDFNYLIYVANQEYRKREKGWEPIVNYRQYITGKEDRLKEIQEVYEAGLKWSLEYFETIYKRLGTKFDGYYPESWVGEYGMKIVEEGLKKGVLEKSKGAVVYKGEKEGLHTRVFINKLGLPTYETKDLGLAYAKYQDFKFDLSINIFGKEIDEYYKVVREALKKIRPKLGEKSTHVPHGMVNLPEGKMSSRTGNVITVEWLLEETKKQVLKIMDKAGFSGKEKQETAEIVALGAVRYALLKSSPGNNVVFDIGSSVSLEGNSGPYLQYSFARAKSVMEKAGVDPTTSWSQADSRSTQDDKADIESLSALSNRINEEEMAVLRMLYRFPELVKQAADEYAPNVICTYLYELAQRFNAFYNKYSILNPQDAGAISNKKQVTSFRLGLTASVAQVLKNGLYLLGIKAPEKM